MTDEKPMNSPTAQEQLDEAHTRLESILAAVEIGTWTYEIALDRIIADTNLARLFGVSPQVAAGGRIDDYLSAIHPEDRPRVEQAIAAAIDAGSLYEAEYRIAQHDGSWRSVIARGKVERDETGRAVRLPGVVLDITQRVRAQEDRKNLAGELALQSRVVESVMSAITDFAYTFNPDGRFVYANKALLDLWGLELKDAVGKNFFDLAYPPELAAKLQSQIQSVFETRQSLSDETAYTSPSGVSGFYEYILTPVLAPDGSVELVAGSTRDITRRKQAEEELRQSQARFRQLADTIPQLAWMAKPDGWIFWYNHRWHEYTGTTPQQMDGWGWQSVHDPDQLPHVLDKWRQSIESGKPFDMTFPLRGGDGKFRPFLTRVMPLLNEQQEIVLWFGTNTDVSQQQQLMQERDDLLASERAARADAERAGRLKDEFLATLSHELRTPLNAILGWSQLLRRPDQIDSEMERGLAIIERNARVQAQLIEDLLDMSRIISGKMRIDVQDVDIADITSASIEALRPAADAKDITLQKVLDTRIGPMRADPARLQQVLWNLLSNAIKFTPGGGKVQVELQRIDSHVQITVTDTGSGIPPEFLPYVFERFRQADGSTTRKHAGLGLGLAIVKNLIELHGGKVRAQSAGEGLGATFIVELPLAVPQADSAGLARARPRPPVRDSTADFNCEPDSLSGVTVLVVDDEEDARNLIARVLQECKAKVLLASSAAQALDMLKTKRPTVLLSDIGMPGQDGYDFIGRVRILPEDQGGKIPAAALTAFARSEDRMRALRAGYQSHVAKPVEPAELVMVVASLAGRTGPK